MNLVVDGPYTGADFAVASSSGNVATVFEVRTPVVSFDHSLIAYFDAGQTPTFSIGAIGATGIPVVNASMTGHLLDCSSVPCALILQ